MTEPKLKIKHGELLDVTGRPLRFEDVTFVPANVSLNGTSFSFSHSLDTYAAKTNLATRSLVKPGDDAPWVLGRLMFLFNAQLDSAEFRPEKSCLQESFIAVLHSYDNLAVPFGCIDHYCRTSLMFSSEDAPSAEIQDFIAERFWTFLLSEPSALVDYEARMFHSGACIWIRYGVESGEPFMIETED